MEYVFDIKGIGKRPLALEHIVIDCQVGEATQKSIMVPNYTKTIQTFKVRFFSVSLKVFSKDHTELYEILKPFTCT